MCVDEKMYKDFVVSKNILEGKPVGYSLREKTTDDTLSGWNVLSIEDDETYVSNTDNFTIVKASEIAKLQPLLLEIYDSMYGTELNWLYDEDGMFKGFFDLGSNQEVSIAQVLTKGML